MNNELISVSDIDSKYASITEGGITVNVTAPQFEITGIVHPEKNEGRFCRLEVARLSEYSDGVKWLSDFCACGRIRFKTDAKRVKFVITLGNIHTNLFHFESTGAYGFDVFQGSGIARKCVAPLWHSIEPKVGDMIVQFVEFDDGIKEVTLNLPLYGAVKDIKIEFPKTAKISLPDDYTFQKPVVFYGSSITQGACVSNPSNCYANIVTRMLDANCYNYGFSGNAVGEQIMADTVAANEMSAFILDYDWNAPTPEHLENTHYNFYKTVRNAHPYLPIVIMGHPDFICDLNDDVAAVNMPWSNGFNSRKRHDIVLNTYARAIAEGDKKVWYVHASQYFPIAMKDLCTVDFCHPNDLGHYLMAQSLYTVLKYALKAN